MKPLFSPEMLLRGEVTPEMARRAGSTLPKLVKPLPYGNSTQTKRWGVKTGSGHK